MLQTELCFFLFLILLPAHIGSICVSKVYQECNNSREIPKGITTNCSDDFSVSVDGPGPDVKEGDDVTLTCSHNFPNESAMFTWLKDEKIMKDKNKKKLQLKSILSNVSGSYVCMVNSSCGCGESEPHQLKVSDQSVLLIIVCGISALALVVILGVVMKFKLKRDNEKHQERRRQRAQAGQAAAPNPLTPRTNQ